MPTASLSRQSWSNSCFSQTFPATSQIIVREQDVAFVPARLRRNRSWKERTRGPLLTEVSCLPTSVETTTCYWGVGKIGLSSVNGHPLLDNYFWFPPVHIGHQGRFNVAIGLHFASASSFDFDSEYPVSITKVDHLSALPGGKVLGSRLLISFLYARSRFNDGRSQSNLKTD